MTSAVPIVATGNPFPGLRSYDRSFPWKLFGRDTDLSLMATRVLSGRTTLLFAGTGVGKTSFLDAKLVPYFESRFAIVVHRMWASDTPLALLRSSILAALEIDRQGASEDISLLLKQLADKERQPVLLILDQFEEIFQHHKDTAAIRGFQNVIARLICDNSHDVRLILSMREEFLGELSFFEASVPDLFSNHYHLKNLSSAQATEIIEDTAGTRISIGIAKRVECDGAKLQLLIKDLKKVPGDNKNSASDLTRDYVPPPYLQIVCHRIWAKTTPEKTGKPFLSDYSENAAIGEFHAYCEEKLVMPERDKELVAEAFGFLMSRSGAKMAYELGDLARLLRVDERELAMALRRLSTPEVRILRAFADPDKKPWFELYHDMYAPFLMNWKAERDAAKRRQMEELARRAEEQRLELDRQKEIEKQRLAELTEERRLKQQQELELKKRRRDLLFNRLAFGTAILLLVLVVLVWNPIRQARVIKEATKAISDPSAQQGISDDLVKQAYDNLRRDSYLMAISPSFRPKVLWAKYWGARADAEARGEDRDMALLYNLKMLAEGPALADPGRKWATKLLMGGSYDRLLHSYPSGPRATPLGLTTDDAFTLYEDDALHRWNTLDGQALPPVSLQRDWLEAPGGGSDSDQGRRNGQIGPLAVSPNGAFLAVQWMGDTPPAESRRLLVGPKTPAAVRVAIFEIKSGKRVFRTIPVSPSSLLSPLLRFPGWKLPVIFSPDGSMLGVANGEKIQLWRLTNPGENPIAAGAIPLPKTFQFAAAFSPDGKRLALATPQSITIWGTERGVVPRLLETRHYPVSPLPVGSGLAMRFAPTARLFLENDLMAVVRSYDLRVWDSHGKILRDFTLPAPALQLAFRKLDKKIVVVSAGALYACDLGAGKVEMLKTLAGRRTMLAHDGASYVSFEEGFGFRQWAVPSGPDAASQPENQYSAYFGNISPDGKYVAMLEDTAPTSSPGHRGRTSSTTRSSQGRMLPDMELTVYRISDHALISRSKTVLNEDSPYEVAVPFAFVDNETLLVDEGAGFGRLSLSGQTLAGRPKTSPTESIAYMGPATAYLIDREKHTCRIWDVKNSGPGSQFDHCNFLVFRSNDEVGVFDPDKGVTFQSWTGQSWKQKETVWLPNGDEITTLAFGPGAEALTVTQGRRIIVYRIESNMQIRRLASWRNPAVGVLSLFQSKNGDSVYITGGPWVHRIFRTGEDSIGSIDVPDTDLLDHVAFAFIDNGHIRTLRRRVVKSIAPQEFDTVSPVAQDKSDEVLWSKELKVWQQKLGSRLPQGGALPTEATADQQK